MSTSAILRGSVSARIIIRLGRGMSMPLETLTPPSYFIRKGREARYLFYPIKSMTASTVGLASLILAL